MKRIAIALLLLLALVPGFARAQNYSDDFNRSNSTTISGWTQQAGSWRIQSNRVQHTASALGLLVYDGWSGGADQTMSAVIAPDGYEQGLAGRISGNSWYACYVVGSPFGGAGTYLVKYTNGAQTVLASGAAPSYATPALLTLTITGSSLSCVSSAATVSATDTTFATGKAGLHAFLGSSDAAYYYDDFSLTVPQAATSTATSTATNTATATSTVVPGSCTTYQANTTGLSVSTPNLGVDATIAWNAASIAEMRVMTLSEPRSLLGVINPTSSYVLDGSLVYWLESDTAPMRWSFCVPAGVTPTAVATSTPTAIPDPATSTPTATPDPATSTPTAAPDPATSTPTATPDGTATVTPTAIRAVTLDESQIITVTSNLASSMITLAADTNTPTFNLFMSFSGLTLGLFLLMFIRALIRRRP